MKEGGRQLRAHVIPPAQKAGHRGHGSPETLTRRG